jgi:hypothetical protein
LTSAAWRDDHVDHNGEEHAVGQRTSEAGEFIALGIDRSDDDNGRSEHRCDVLGRSAATPPLTVKQVEELATVRVTE